VSRNPLRVVIPWVVMGMAASLLMTKLVGQDSKAFVPESRASTFLSSVPMPIANTARATRRSGLTARLQAADALVLRQLLEAGAFDSLEQRFAALRAAAGSDLDAESAYFAAFDDLGQSSRAKAIMTWSERRPASGAAQLAQAALLINVAAERRGTKFAASTSPKQFEDMELTLDAAAEVLLTALARDPEALPGYLLVMDLAMLRGQAADILAALDRAVIVSPLSVFARQYALAKLTPRWGGSHQTMSTVADVADSLARANPELLALKGYVDWDKARLAYSDRDTARALELAASSLRYGTTFPLCHEKAEINWRYDRFEDALAAAECAVEQRPTDAESHFILSDISYNLGRKHYPADHRRWFGQAHREARTAYLLDSTDIYVLKHWRFVDANVPVGWRSR
jgi:tetratricopeptide (TPR) repeat protein